MSYCDELKIRRFYSEPGIVGGRTCELWTERTCKCKDNSGGHPKGYDDEKCKAFLNETNNE